MNSLEMLPTWEFHLIEYRILLTLAIVTWPVDR